MWGGLMRCVVCYQRQVRAEVMAQLRVGGGTVAVTMRPATTAGDVQACAFPGAKQISGEAMRATASLVAGWGHGGLCNGGVEETHAHMGASALPVPATPLVVMLACHCSSGSAAAQQSFSGGQWTVYSPMQPATGHVATASSTAAAAAPSHCSTYHNMLRS
jgi:hypothetical protein